MRGIGSLFYIAYALGHGSFEQADRHWAIAGLTVATSVVLHGVTATPAMSLLDRTRERVARRHDVDPERSAALLAHLPPGQALLTSASGLPPEASPERVLRLAGGRIEPA